MRLKSVYISKYKNLKDFTLLFDGGSFVDVFVGKNGTGKSNLFEALIEILHHLHKSRRRKAALSWSYKLLYEVHDTEVEIKWDTNTFTIDGIARKTTGSALLPDNVLVYYSGHNTTVTRLVKSYETSFRRRIKRVGPDEARYLMGIGPDYKELLLAVLLMQPKQNIARDYICKKLGIQSISNIATLTLKRHLLADKKKVIDSFDSETIFWGLKGASREFINSLISCIKGDFNLSDLYDQSQNIYSIPIDIDLFRDYFSNKDSGYIFRQFDNLKTLGMIDDFSIPLQLNGGVAANTSYFSDGQFQSVYIYSIVELFKDRNCITLLDEPDAFLHPEWQFDFLKQVLEITDSASKNNHVLMSSHSAATLFNYEEKYVSLFRIAKSAVTCTRRSKKQVIHELSNSFIQYSEDESKLLIDNVIRASDKPILFVEGPSDVSILNTALKKLYPEEDIFILVQDAFDRGFIRTLIARSDVYVKYPDKQFFALFDFDDAYDDWRELRGSDVEMDIHLGLCKKLKDKNAHAFLLPIPKNQLKNQVWNESNPNVKIRSKPHFCIEHIFWGVEGFDKWFRKDRKTGIIKFKGDKHKVKFAKEVVPTLDKISFEVFRPMFEVIRSKCPSVTNVL